MRITRRELLGRSIPVALGLAAIACSRSAPAATSSSGQAAPAAGGSNSIQLDLLAWTYAIDVVKANLTEFEAMNPGVTVRVADSSWGDYHEAVVSRFAAGGRPPDVLYASDHWLGEWAEAGWIIPVEDKFPQVAGYKTDLAPSAIEGLTYKGKMYGLPYYGDLIGFIYNADHLMRAAIETPPSTWDEMLAQARTIKAKGITNYPISAGLNQSDAFAIEILQSMAFSRGGEIFDQDLNPVFEQPNSSLAQSADWIHTAMSEQLMDPQSLQNDMNSNIKAVGAGTHSFTVARLTALSNFNNPAESPAAGNINFKMAQIPGTTGITTGYTRFYALGNGLGKRGQADQAAAWKLLEFLGGKTNGEYKIAKRWSIDKGIGFAQLSLFDDPDIKAAWGKWVDLTALKQQFGKSRVKAGLTPWFAKWDIFTRAEIQKAYLGSEPTPLVMKSLADRWRELQREAKS